MFSELYIKIMPYVKIARVDHYIKNIFVLPGILLAFLILDLNFSYSYLSKIILGLCAISLVSSSNYVINELVGGGILGIGVGKKNLKARGSEKTFFRNCSK